MSPSPDRETAVPYEKLECLKKRLLGIGRCPGIQNKFCMATSLRPAPIRLDQVQEELVPKELDELIQKGAVEKTEAHSEGFYPILFLRSQTSNKSKSLKYFCATGALQDGRNAYLERNNLETGLRRSI